MDAATSRQSDTPTDCHVSHCITDLNVLLQVGQKAQQAKQKASNASQSASQAAPEAEGPVEDFVEAFDSTAKSFFQVVLPDCLFICQVCFAAQQTCHGSTFHYHIVLGFFRVFHDSSVPLHICCTSQTAVVFFLSATVQFAIEAQWRNPIRFVLLNCSCNDLVACCCVVC